MGRFSNDTNKKKKIKLKPPQKKKIAKFDVYRHLLATTDITVDLL